MSDAPGSTLMQAAQQYLQRGWSPIPIPPKSKRPIIKGWPALQLRRDELEEHFGSEGNIGLALGHVSGGLVDVDLDCDEAVELASQYLPSTTAISGRPSRRESHWWYYSPDVDTVKFKDPVSGEMLVELRGSGTQTIVGPSIHPDGEQYDNLTGEPAVVPAPMLTACVKALADRIIRQRHGALPQPPVPKTNTPVRPIRDDDTVEARAIAYLDALPAAVSGQSGHNAAFTAATALVHGFAIEPERALDILRQHYNPRCEPAWSEKELAHKIQEAATKPHERPLGWLRDSERFDVLPDSPVDISGITTQFGSSPRTDDPPESQYTDPGRTPEELMRVPGFINAVIDYTLEASPYPNPMMAFAGALALLSLLTARKVRDPGDNRTNLYILGLAYSSAGKDQPRKTNTKILCEIGMGGLLGSRFASGEGLEDTLAAKPCMLYQTDEIDGMLRSINYAKDGRHEAIMGTLLTLYSSSNSALPIRSRAKIADPGSIEQPSLTIFGTAIPNYYYGALSERMLSNGFFARMLILEGGLRGRGQEPGIVSIPQHLIDHARWWAEYRPSGGNLHNQHPVPTVVEQTDGAKRLLIDTRLHSEDEYDRAQLNGDIVGTTVWGRVSEQSRKLSLLYAVSANHKRPLIDESAAEWAVQLVMHQTRRMLFMAQGHVAANDFDAECLKILQKLRDEPGHEMPHSVLLKRMKTNAKSFREMIATLQERGDLVIDINRTAGRNGTVYRLTRA